MGTGQVSEFPVTGLPAGPYGAAWTYGNGNLGFDINTGGVYQVAITDPSSTPTLSVVASSPGPASTVNDGTSCPNPTDTDLAIVKTGPPMVETDGSVTWTLAVTNNGPGTSSGYVVTDDVPAGYTSVASTTPGCTASGRTVTCIGGTLRDSASTTINITATAPTTVGCLTNTATVEANEPDPTVTNNSSQYETCVAAPFAAIAIVKYGTVAPVADQNGALLDDVISYTYAVTNTGNEPLNAVAVSDPTLGAVSCPQPTLAPGDSECAWPRPTTP